MSIGEQIRAGREELRLTQEELAEKLDISRQAVSKSGSRLRKLF